MTIVSLLATIWTIIQLSASVAGSDVHYRFTEYLDENGTESELYLSQHFAVSHLSVSRVYLLKRKARTKYTR